MSRDTLLIVDDVEINRDILTCILKEDYRIVAANDGISALKEIESEGDRLVGILLDLVMPNMDGYGVLRELNSRGTLVNVPVLIISSEDSHAVEKECFVAGVSDFIHKPFDRELVRTRVRNTVSLFMYRCHLEEKIEEQTKIIQKRNDTTIDLLASVVETRDLESGAHVLRVKEYTRIIAEELREHFPKYGLTRHSVDVIVAASALHDVGKIAISDYILLKPGKLTDEEFTEMKTHTTKGADFILRVQNMWDEEYSNAGYEIAKYHHEKFGGKGYPEGLVGNDIPIAAQIVSVADVYDALVSKRCYKNAFDKRDAFNMIMNGECGEFNPDILECLRSRILDFEKCADTIS